MGSHPPPFPINYIAFLFRWAPSFAPYRTNLTMSLKTNKRKNPRANSTWLAWLRPSSNIKGSQEHQRCREANTQCPPPPGVSRRTKTSGLQMEGGSFPALGFCPLAGRWAVALAGPSPQGTVPCGGRLSGSRAWLAPGQPLQVPTGPAPRPTGGGDSSRQASG